MENKFSIGIMQGRLSCKRGLPLQSFPESWQDEFKNASQLGFQNIEWLIDEKGNNPISTPRGRNQIRKESSKYNIEVSSLCAHQLMTVGLLDEDKKSEQGIKQFKNIVSWGKELEVKYIVLPAMETLSIKSSVGKAILKELLRNNLKPSDPTILIECDLPMSELVFFIEDVDLENVKVLYDIGNATADGYDTSKEIIENYSLIGEIHIKDRYFKGGSNRLGHADVDFDAVAKALKQVSWRGNVVLETPVFEDWLTEAVHNISFTKKWLGQILPSREKQS
jgi:sugar phosphate isomerase/epimerase